MQFNGIERRSPRRLSATSPALTFWSAAGFFSALIVQQIEAIRDQTIVQIQNLLATAGPILLVNGMDVV